MTEFKNIMHDPNTTHRVTYEKIKLYQLALHCLTMACGAIILLMFIIIMHNQKQIVKMQLQIMDLLKFLKEPVVLTREIPSQLIEPKRMVENNDKSIFE
jgi:hypothetical protein